MTDETMEIEGRAVRWCVLRTAGPRTLPLARSLVASGLRAWTPTARVERRLSRRPTRVQYDAPFTPTYVFVGAEHLDELNRCLAQPINPHPAFSIFRPNGETAFVADRQLATLRAMEERSEQLLRRRLADRERGKAEPYQPGVEVGIGGAFAGLPSTVAKSDRRWTEVTFAPGFTLKIDTSHLRSLGVPSKTAK